VKRQTSICFPRKASNEGGPSTFQKNLENFLRNNDYEIYYPENNVVPTCVIVISGTKKLFWLLKMKFKGVKIIQRLDGMNWKLWREEKNIFILTKQILQNFLILLIRNYLADHVVYQSKFVESWWDDKFGKVKKSSVILNGTDMQIKQHRTFIDEKFTITCIEGTIQKDNLTQSILKEVERIPDFDNRVKEVEIYGNHSNYKNMQNDFKNLNFKGRVSKSDLEKTLSQKKRIFFLLELNPPCPNSMIEAICMGIPCLGFDTGAYRELLDGAGIAMEYNGDIWNLEEPNLKIIKDSLNQIIINYDFFSQRASEISVKYDANVMCNKYLRILEGL
jgi:glycosyltransferase involved in cell wall biosynthesis